MSNKSNSIILITCLLQASLNCAETSAWYNWLFQKIIVWFKTDDRTIDIFQPPLNIVSFLNGYICRCDGEWRPFDHNNDVIMSAMASQITNLAVVYSTVYSGTDQRKHQSPASLLFVRGIHQWPVNTLHKGPVTRKMFLFDDVIMILKKEYCR